MGFAEFGESVILSDCNICLLPKDVRALIICEGQRGSVSSDYWKKSFWFNKGCEEIEYLHSYFYTFSLQSLEILLLYELNSLKGLFREEKVAPHRSSPSAPFPASNNFQYVIVRI